MMRAPRGTRAPQQALASAAEDAALPSAPRQQRIQHRELHITQLAVVECAL
jgi:hypothetical protein